MSNMSKRNKEGRRMRWQEPSEAPDIHVFRTSRHIARIPRKCGCGKIIQPGTEYQLTAGTEDGKFFSVAYCMTGGDCVTAEAQNAQYLKDKALFGSD